MAVQEVSVDQLDEALAAGGRVVDVREPDEYVAGHVPGAVLVALATVPDRLDAFRGDGPTYVICKSGARSRRACEFLEGEGIDAVNVAGGTLAWVDGGHPFDTGPG